MSHSRSTGPPRDWTREKRRQHLPLLLAAVVFLIGGTAAIQDGALLIGVTNIVAGLLNLAATSTVGRSRRLTAVAVNVVNAVVALVLVIVSVQAGKHYIQYAWGLATIIFVVAAVVAYRRGTGS
jgi:fumarate reductase subunit D